LRGTVIASKPLASSAAISRTGTVPNRSRSITPSAIEAANSRAVLIASAPEVMTGAVAWMGAVSVGMGNLQSAELATASPGSLGSR
jgi:hypothetical protein